MCLCVFVSKYLSLYEVDVNASCGRMDCNEGCNVVLGVRCSVVYDAMICKHMQSEIQCSMQCYVHSVMKKMSDVTQ